MIPSRRVFEDNAADYDRWFDDHRALYNAQVCMLRSAVPRTARGLEVGIGSGRFAVSLGIRCGIDPSRELIRIARRRGIEGVRGEGEYLPYRAGTFDYVLMMTVICYLEDPMAVFREVNRVLKDEGLIVLGFIESGGKIHQEYLHEPVKGRFLRHATFRTVDEVTGFLNEAGFDPVNGMKRTRGFCVMKGKRM